MVPGEGDVEQHDLPWRAVEEVCTPAEAAKLREDTAAELLDPAFRRKVADAMAGGKAVRHEGRCLLVVGPSAAGKSTAIETGKLRVPEGALVLDGEFMREVSATWARMVALARAKGVAGFKNYFEEFFKASQDKAKEQIVIEALQSRANIIVPDTASNVKHSLTMLDRVLAAGYAVEFAAVYADRSTCEHRGALRKSKKYTSKNWETSVQSILDLHAHLQSRGALRPGADVQIFSNTSVLFTTTLEHIRDRLEEHRQEVRHCGQSRWCEIGLLAGVYEAPDQDRQLEIIPSCLDEEVVRVSMAVVQKGALVETAALSFDVASCRLVGAGSPPSQAWHLGVAPDGRARLQPVDALGSARGGPLLQIGPVPGKSLERSVATDGSLREALNGLDFCQHHLREFTEEERRAAEEAARVAGGREVPTRDRPRALLVVSPSGGGKSTVERTFVGHFGMDPDQAVFVDSDRFRDYHAQYKALLENGQANKGIWYRSWPAGKDAIIRTKSRILDLAVERRKDLVVSDTASEPKKLLQMVDKLKAAGYTVHLCGVYAAPKEIVARGVDRELVAGKRFNRDVGKLCKTFDAFAPVAAAVNGRFCFVRNGNGRSPELYKEGDGGSRVSFDLEEALAWSGPAGVGGAAVGSGAEPRSEEPECTEVSPADLRYIMEGNENMVLSYHGTRAGWEGSAFRCRKGDNSKLVADHRFASAVAAPLLGASFVEVGTLLGLTPENVQAIDEAMFEQRAPNRRAKRLDTKVRHPCGRVLALQLANLMSIPDMGCARGKVVTVELKPKCGLTERRGLPSRFRLLQQHKVKVGKIDRISLYDPVKVLSKEPALVKEALLASLDSPQNTLRVFVDGVQVFSEEALTSSRNTPTGASALEEELSAAGVGGEDSLLSILAALLSAPSLPLPERLRRAQAWAAGETGHIVNELYRLLRIRVGAALADDLLSKAESFETALDGLESCPSDEGGIDLATQQMDAALAAAHAHPEWDAATEAEVVRWCCRFLLGRTAQDVSVLFNLVEAGTPDALPADVQDMLRRHRFVPLAEFLPVGPDAWRPLWCRITTVDFDVKAASKIPEYATQLDEYAEDYYRRFASDPAPSPVPEGKAVAIGGHAGAILFEGDVVWKRDQGGSRGRSELQFCRWALDDPVCSRLVPALVGYRTHDGYRWIGLANLLHGLERPAVLDLKMGTRTWSSEASAEKAESQAQKAKNSTTASLGVRVVAGKLRNEAGEAIPVGYRNDLPVKDERELSELLATFLCTESLRESVRAQVREIGAWWHQQREFALYASSLLLAYDSARKAECRVKMIDFANVQQIRDKSEDLSGYDVGLRTLDRVLAALAPPPQGSTFSPPPREL